ncbi:MAG: hypothetical protein ACTSRP_22805 [Candidatus Helarchaeota archaeon]
MFIDIILKEYIKVIINALEKNDLQIANIFCNRIITDATFNEMEAATVIGAILKESITDSFSIPPDTENFKKIKKEIVNLIENIREIDFLNEEKDQIKQVWILYYKYFKKIRDQFLLPYEIHVYSLNKSFSKSITKFCLKFLIKELQNTNYSSNSLWSCK